MKTSARLGRRRSMSRSKVRSPALAQVAARFKAVVLLPSPALALVTSKRHDRPALVGDAQQAGPDVAIGVGLDRIGRPERPEVARPDASRRSAGSAGPPPGAAASDRASRAPEP